MASPEICYLLRFELATQIELPEFFLVQQKENVTDVPGISAKVKLLNLFHCLLSQV
jgi:hypothetical protein